MRLVFQSVRVSDFSGVIVFFDNLLGKFAAEEQHGVICYFRFAGVSEKRNYTADADVNQC